MSTVPVQRRQRNSFVAEYLGIDAETEKWRFDRSSPPPPDAQPAAVKAAALHVASANPEVARKGSTKKASAKTSATSEAPSKQVSDEAVPAKAPPLQTANRKRKRAAKVSPGTGEAGKSTKAKKKVPAKKLPSDGPRAKKPNSKQLPTPVVSFSHDGRTICTPSSTATLVGDQADDEFDDFELDDAFSTIEGNNSTTGARAVLCPPPLTSDDPLPWDKAMIETYDDGIDDDDLMMLMADDFSISGSARQYNGNPASQQPALEPSHDQVKERKSTERTPHSQFVSPTTPHTQLSLQKINIKPIVRPPFPSPVRDRSPVIGLSSDRLLRTCFRIGEAINAGRNAVKNGKNVLIELYARVLSSERDDKVQHFVLCDLFHSKPPYLKAEYDAGIWRSVALHEFDSRVFLEQEGKMCRCILTAKSSGKEWTMLNIWPAKEDDILWVEGIVNS